MVERNLLIRMTRFLIFMLCFLQSFSIHSMLVGKSQSLDIELIDTPLWIAIFTQQTGVANSDFKMNLSRYISHLKPELTYRVTNHWSQALNHIELLELPSGLTHIDDGVTDCLNQFSLRVNYSCILRFEVDKDNYTPMKTTGPLICADGGVVCASPPIEQQFDNAVQQASNTEVLVSPAIQDGLHYDPSTLSIIGKPTRLGNYYFTVSAIYNDKVAAPSVLTIRVDANIEDQPRFKSSFTIPNASPGQHYQLNVLDLIESNSIDKNQINFRICPNHPSPSWLSFDKYNLNLLQGDVPLSDAGKTLGVTIIASTKTGGDSDYLQLKIPVASDPTKKPSFREGTRLYGTAGSVFRHRFNFSVIDPAEDDSLKIIIDKIEPAAPWLSMTTDTDLEGIVPEDAVGNTYSLTVIAHTNTGGNSDPAVIPLTIEMNELLKPQLISGHPKCPLMHRGKSYVYDFVAHRDIEPLYEDYPYSIELAKGYDNPEWVRIEDNKLIIDRVPEHIKLMKQVYVTIRNTPGGMSNVLSFPLYVIPY